MPSAWYKLHYVMIESTLWFDDVEVIPGLLPFLWAVQRSHMRSRKRSRRPPENEAMHLSVCHSDCQSMQKRKENLQTGQAKAFRDFIHEELE